MQRCNASDADLVLDTWAWRCLALAAAASVHRKLAASQGAHWPHGAAPRRRWRVWAGALLGLLLRGSLPWRRLTLSPSVPRGLYRLHHCGGIHQSAFVLTKSVHCTGFPREADVEDSILDHRQATEAAIRKMREYITEVIEREGEENTASKRTP